MPSTKHVPRFPKAERATVRRWYSRELKGWVFADRGDPGRFFTIRLEEVPGSPHQLNANGYGLKAARDLRSSSKGITVSEAPMVLFCAHQGHGFFLRPQVGVATGVIPELMEKGFLAEGRLVGKWREFLTKP